jgi:hypothetical protein
VPKTPLERAALDVKYEVEVAQNLERVHPGFEGSGFVAKDPGACPNCRKKFPGAHRARKGKAGLLSKRRDRKNSQQQRCAHPSDWFESAAPSTAIVGIGRSKLRCCEPVEVCALANQAVVLQN